MPYGYIGAGEPRTLIQKSTAAIVAGAVVKNSGTGGCVVATGDDVGICGVALEDAGNVVGNPVRVASSGVADCNAGGTITLGDPVTATTAGKVIVISGAGLHQIIGFAEEAAVNLDKVSVRLMPGETYI